MVLRSRDGEFVVDLDSRTCTCRKWELTGIPCAHGCAAILEKRDEPIHYVHDCYMISTYLTCYEKIVMPLNGKKLWPPVDREPFRPPAWHVPRRGRRQKKRRLQPEELVVNQRGGTSKMKKHGTVTMTCSICRLTGHNKCYHDKHDAPQQDWLGPDDASQTMSQKSASTAKGKLQPRRSKKSASTSTCEPAPPKFHFMPTPGFIPATSDMYTYN
ncbi:SWIM-type domain-containing protein [Abeliophyllum distichum]|uniref:SWIM-type domain-containing protein n=1 Tax=Abeliophyllum distichum TaxID=126358 RepID=A0ABD1VY68_9LAMI